MNISSDVNYNKKVVKAILGSDDIVFFDFELGKTSALCVYVDSITDKELLGLEVLAPLGVVMRYSRRHIAAFEKIDYFICNTLVFKSELDFGTNVLCPSERILFERFFEICETLYRVVEVGQNLEEFGTVESVEKHRELTERYRALVKMFGFFDHVVPFGVLNKDVNAVAIALFRSEIGSAVLRRY